MNTERYTEEQVEKALRDAKGMLTYAARSLGCTLHTVKNYIERYPGLARVRVEAREEIVDMAEAALVKQINEGNAACIIYALNQLGRHKGYGVRMQSPEEAPTVHTGATETYSEIILPNGQRILI
jgi:hypothetical protein